MQEAQYMDKMMEYWDSLEENEVDGKKFVLIAAICVLAGIIFGMLISPKKTSKSSVRVMTAIPAMAPPSASEPVSPIKILAG